MTHWGRALILVVPALLSACQSDSSPTCSLAGGTQLATAPWPKFRADTANTGRAPNVDLTASTGNGVLLFDGYCSGTTTQTCIVDSVGGCPIPQTCLRIGTVATTPIVGPPGSTGAPSLYLASSDGNVYVLNPPNHCSVATAQMCSVDDDCPSGQTCLGTLTDSIEVLGAIVGSPLLGEDGTLFVPSNGLLSQFRIDGTQRYAAGIPGFVTASPNIWNGKYCSVTTAQTCSDDADCPSGETCLGSVDGTIYVGSQAGLFTGVCPNGVPRFGVSFPGTQSTAAIVPDPNFIQPTPIIIAGGLGGQVRAYNVRGRQYWSFFASATVVAAVLVDPTTELFYVADTSGRVFAGTLINGQLDPDFLFAPAQMTPPVEAPASITASPALGRDAPDTPERERLYVAGQSVLGQDAADQRGVLYALDRATGTVCWTFEAEGPITSSPAVATGGTRDVIVFAADVLDDQPDADPVAIGGRVYAVPDRDLDDDQCDGERRSRDEALWIFDPASIDPSGHSYSIGASSPSIGADGTVYIGRTGSRLGTGAECPGEDPCVVNDGGALYAINMPPTPEP
jgi:outer membrane protein assembly factor BamB